VLVLDAGAFVAVGRGDRDVVALAKRERLAGRPPVTSGGVAAEVWRGGRGRQAELARLLAGVQVAAIDGSLGRRAGMLLARSGQSDATDAAVVCLAERPYTDRRQGSLTRNRSAYAGLPLATDRHRGRPGNRSRSGDCRR
jgi:hypothetical protein